MTILGHTFKSIGILVVLSVFSSFADAQATRTWVSGVGDDANPCSRTAPCKTFAGAISKTAAGGEINVLDPGGFGAITITKSITISSEQTEAGVLVAGTNGIIVSLPTSTSFVVLRGLDIEGLGTGINGINFIGQGTLSVEKCTINNFTLNGINFTPNNTSELFVKDTIIRNNTDSSSSTNGGILIQPSAGTATASLAGVRMENNRFGLSVQDNSTVTAWECIASGNSHNGFLCVSSSSPAKLFLENCVTANNGVNGIATSGAGGATIWISNVSITGNATGLNTSGGGSISSFGNNRNAGNTNNGVPTLAAPLQ